MAMLAIFRIILQGDLHLCLTRLTRSEYVYTSVLRGVMLSFAAFLTGSAVVSDGLPCPHLRLGLRVL